MPGPLVYQITNRHQRFQFGTFMFPFRYYFRRVLVHRLRLGGAVAGAGGEASCGRLKGPMRLTGRGDIV